MISVDVQVLLPVLAPLTGSVLVLAADVLLLRAVRVHYAIAFISLLVGAVGTVGSLGSRPGDASRTLCLPDASACFYSAGALAGTLQLAVIAGAAAALLLAWPQERADLPERAPVTVSLLLAATGGAVGVAAARDLGSWLVTLELATLPVIILVALPGTRSAVAGALQLLTTSLVSFAMLTLAAACWYAATGSPLLGAGSVLTTLDPSAAVSTSTPRFGLLALAVVLVLGGLGFKLSLVPFHAWTPTAYAGAPLPIAAFLAGTSKVAALAALLVVVTSVSSAGTSALVATAVLAIASMTLGNVMALRQDDVVRLLAWSTVAQAGWVVLPLVSLSQRGARSSAAYLVTYVVATLVAFSVVAVVARAGGGSGVDGSGGRELTAYRGLLRSRPVLGASLALALTSLAGLPPGILGLVGKVVALRPVVAEGWWLLAVLAALNAVLGVAIYLRWFRVLLEPSGRPPQAAPPAVHPSHALAVGLAAAALVVLSVQPQLLLGVLGG